MRLSFPIADRRLLVALAPILLLLSLARPAHAALRWDVVESTPQRLVVEATVDGHELVAHPDGRWQELRIPGAYAVGEPGLPLLPQAVRMFALPPGAEPTLRVELLSSEELGQVRLLPHPVAELQPPDALLESPRMSQEHAEGEGYERFAHGSDQLARLAPVRHSQGLRLSAIQLEPLVYDAASGRLALATHVRVTVELGGRNLGAGEPVRLRPALAGQLLNAGQAEEWGSEPPRKRQLRERWAALGRSGRAPASTFDPSLLAGPEFRLRVGTTGLVRVKVSDLLDKGLDPATKRQELRMYLKRPTHPDSAGFPAPQVVELPFSFLEVGAPDAVVGTLDELIFHGFHPRDMGGEIDAGGQTFPAPMAERPDNWNSHTIVWVARMQAGSGPWARMEEITLPPSQGAPREMYFRDEHFEQDLGFQDNPNSLEVQRYHWNDRFESDVRRPIRMSHPVPDSTVELSWTMVGRNVGDPKTLDFLVEQGAASQLLASISLVSGGYPNLTSFTRTVPAGLLGEGPVTFVMRSLEDGQQRNVAAQLGSVTARYWAQYRASGGRARVQTGSGAGAADLEIRGFTTAPELAFDITDSRSPRRINLSASNLVDDGQGGVTVSFSVDRPSGGERWFEATSRILVPRIQPGSIERDDTPLIHVSMPAAQVLAVGPEAFRGAAQPWLDWRQQDQLGTGWRVAYVDVQQIYDDFGSGLKSPAALKRFFEWAWVEWGLAAILLCGDANEDARGVYSNAPDVVPSSIHIQVYAGAELLASDKWYGIFGAGEFYPNGLDQGPDVLVGRLPAKGSGMLGNMISKVLAYEQPNPTDSWRARTLWVADDAYSSDLIGAGEGCYSFQSSEQQFLSSQQLSANLVSSSLDGRLSGTVWSLDEFTSQFRTGEQCETLSSIVSSAGQLALSNLRGQLDEGWLWVSYQGHANYNVFGHEQFFNNTTARILSNTGKPFLFFGMGCHVSDFHRLLEDTPQSPSIGELLLSNPGGGAIATYGSSGFEFLFPNKTYMELITENFFAQGQGGSSRISPLPSQWVLGENLAVSELEVLFTTAFRKDEMVAQYNLLGDPLLRMDALPPRATVLADSVTLTDGGTLLPAAGSREVQLDLSVVDESGIAAVELTDSEGRDYSSLLPAPGGDPRQRDGSLALPIHAQGYTVELTVRDGSYPDRWPTTYNFDVPFSLQLFAGGDPVDEGTVPIDQGATVALDVEFTSPIALTEGEIGVRGEGVGISGLTTTSLGGDGRQWRVSFDATGTLEMARALAAAEQFFVLELAGADTEVELSGSGGGGPGDLSIVRHVAVPNPAPGPTQVVAELSRAATWLRLSVFDVSGRPVFSERRDGLTPGAQVSFAYNGVDREGDELANGVYFYRLEAGDATGSARSDMGRLVIMR